MEMKYKAYTLQNYRQISAMGKLSKERIFAIETVGGVLPFKTNNYVTEKLIDWDNYENDPMFILNFPQKDMLKPTHFKAYAAALSGGEEKAQLKKISNNIREQLNPHPAGQVDLNVPEMNGRKLMGIQHKYKETVLFFPAQGQTCHAYCTFCFRWPQFGGANQLKFAMKQADLLVNYVKENKGVTDVLLTGGDPMTMPAKFLKTYVDALLDANIDHLNTIRIGTKSLSFWPYRYLTDGDSDAILEIFESITKKGKHLSLMAHINHPVELSTPEIKQAIARIQATGAVIRTQSPLLKHINAKPEIWTDMWKTQVNLGIVPYYMFVARETGAQHYFAIPLGEASEIFRQAYSKVSGICRTVRGPSMSANPGKVQVNGISEINGEKVFILEFIQARKSAWVGRPFIAKYDEDATWLNQLKPAFSQHKFFFEKEFEKMLASAETHRNKSDSVLSYSS